MNKRLKAMIVLKFGTQEDFAQAIGERSTVVSNVVRNRRRISPHKQLEWAMALNCQPVDIFPRENEVYA